MELDLQKAIINNKQYYVVPEEIFSHLKLSKKEEKGLLRMEFGDNFYLVPTFVADGKPSSEEIDDFVSDLFKARESRENVGCGVTTDDIYGCSWGSDSSGCGSSGSSGSSGCGYEPDPCGSTFFRGRSSC